ncbi:cytoskeleton-associated protein 2-like isoform X2 [Hemiscyllium ocellatum]|uniref:cytoskeleton-associated protein 2-like isoform X2 n=1 Tax=Hemiscyllium ocellatum TaxID=170820 RepID=UPI002965FB83|nr:cytoskeleton-associated protein 2-like isoform X2 [Hemiscyllium ocellatum]
MAAEEKRQQLPSRWRGAGACSRLQESECRRQQLEAYLSRKGKLKKPAPNARYYLGDRTNRKVQLAATAAAPYPRCNQKGNLKAGPLAKPAKYKGTGHLTSSNRANTVATRSETQPEAKTSEAEQTLAKALPAFSRGRIPSEETASALFPAESNPANNQAAAGQNAVSGQCPTVCAKSGPHVDGQETAVGTAPNAGHSAGVASAKPSPDQAGQPRVSTSKDNASYNPIWAIGVVRAASRAAKPAGLVKPGPSAAKPTGLAKPGPNAAKPTGLAKLGPNAAKPEGLTKLGPNAAKPGSNAAKLGPNAAKPVSNAAKLGPNAAKSAGLAKLGPNAAKPAGLVKPGPNAANSGPNAAKPAGLVKPGPNAANSGPNAAKPAGLVKPGPNAANSGPNAAKPAGLVKPGPSTAKLAGLAKPVANAAKATGLVKPGPSTAKLARLAKPVAKAAEPVSAVIVQKQLIDAEPVKNNDYQSLSKSARRAPSTTTKPANGASPTGNQPGPIWQPFTRSVPKARPALWTAPRNTRGRRGAVQSASKLVISTAKHRGAESTVRKSAKGQDERRRLLDEWLASKGRTYKRPPMPTPFTRSAQSVKKNLELSFWEAIEEEEQDEQRGLQARVDQALDGCLQLLQKGSPPEEVAAALLAVPERERFAKFWICRAHLLERTGPMEAVIALFEEAVHSGAQPVEELRSALVEAIMRNASALSASAGAVTSGASDGEADKCTVGDEHDTGGEETDGFREGLATVTPHSRIPRERAGSSVVKYRVTTTPQVHRKEVAEQMRSLGKQEVRFVTPVRRSVRIEQASTSYPEGLREWDHCVTSLNQLLAVEETETFIYQENRALLEEMTKI